jgi:uncharacterized protein YggU (UPF0235/DUF167 family)
MIYKVHVTFHKDFIEVNNDEISVGIKSKPQKGEANRELIQKISKYFNILQYTTVSSENYSRATI